MSDIDMREPPEDPFAQESAPTGQLGRVQPHDDTAERAVLGGLMLAPKAIQEVSEILAPEDFYQPKHEQVYAVILGLASSGQAVDAITVTDQLAKWRLNEPTLAFNLTSAVTTAANVVYHARIVHERAVQRRLITLGTEIAQRGYDGQNASHTVDEAKDMLEKIEGAQPAEVTFIGEAFLEMVDNLQAKPDYIPTPWSEINQLIGGLRPGGLYVIGARPGSGKTIMAAQIATKLAEFGPVAFSALEMPKLAMLERLVSASAQIPMGSLSRHDLSDAEWGQLMAVKPMVENAKIGIDDRPGATVAQIKAQARAVKRRAGGLTAVLVDYLQLVSRTDTRQSEHEFFGEAARQFKVLARELNVPVVILSQLNRESVQMARGQKKSKPRLPSLADLSKSDAIGHHADVVMLLARQVDDEGQETGLLDVVVAKNRQGQTGVRSLIWEGEYSRLGSRKQDTGLF